MTLRDMADKIRKYEDTLESPQHSEILVNFVEECLRDRGVNPLLQAGKYFDLSADRKKYWDRLISY